MTSDEFEELAQLHTLWLAREPAGRRLELQDLSLAGVAVNGARLLRAKLRRVNLGGADLAGASLRGSELEDVRFDGANLARTDFSECTVRRCRFDGARAEGVIFSNGRVAESSFFAAQMTGANFAKSVFEKAVLANAVLGRAHLVRWETKRCDLRVCNFSGADLAAATFQDADLRLAEFSDTHLYATLFAQVKVGGVHGTPFVAEHFGSGLDFSAEGDGTDFGSLQRLRVQLGGGAGPGNGRYGTGATADLYRAYEVTQDGEAHYVISRRAEAKDVLEVRRMHTDKELLVVEFEQLDSRFENWLAADLIGDVLLRGFLQDAYRDKVVGVDCRNLTTGDATLKAYGVHEAPARERGRIVRM